MKYKALALGIAAYLISSTAQAQPGVKPLGCDVHWKDRQHQIKRTHDAAKVGNEGLDRVMAAYSKQD